VTTGSLDSAAAHTGRGGVRPHDEWRVCGEPYQDDVEGRGCTCKAWDPTDYKAWHANARMAGEVGQRKW